jgi:hypothetical protein
MLRIVFEQCLTLVSEQPNILRQAMIALPESPARKMLHKFAGAAGAVLRERFFRQPVQLAGSSIPFQLRVEWFGVKCSNHARNLSSSATGSSDTAFWMSSTFIMTAILAHLLRRGTPRSGGA